MDTFVPFSAAHWAALAACVLLCMGIITFRRQLRVGRRSRIAAAVIAAVLAGLETALYITYTMDGEWTVWSLPFELCTMTLWLSVIMLLTRNRILYSIVVYLGTLGALQAMLTPDLAEAFPQFRYFHFFLGHIGIIAASVYMTAVLQMRPTLRSLPIAVLTLHLLAIPGAIVNSVAGTNYMFLARKPEGGSMLDWLGPWPWYLLELEPIVWAMCAILLGIVSLIDRIGKRSKQAKSSD
ncbi:ABC transporter permease [Paenibacillus sp. CCS19]|uniref:YwaF family protein n=1 Tax=Paenibacillus sp. CCS19 TaxID=3158387 RepID=UPI0025656368|nr:TIGR02206 family membrane protein [Paenibacillus cellulosilyticus]GMK41556.1 ABC transporter permease [Paenibacillus cellulosilyticus]